MQPEIKKLSDYAPPHFFIKEVDLTFHLDPQKTRVIAISKIYLNEKAYEGKHPLILDGEDLELLRVKIDGKTLEPSEYEITPYTMTLFDVPRECILEIETQINPEGNTKLEGLYMSGGYYCTQNEAEGFRRITYFLDRPDVMAKYRTRIIAPKKHFPFLLSNGNLIEKKSINEDLHQAVWEDPFPKPCYLFALVAGDFGVVEDHFITQSQKQVDLKIYCDHGDEVKCTFAMQCLKKAMKWDEERFGLEYDLDLFMIVVIGAFNAGAMENKGLNIFNSAAVLAHKEISTDQDFTYIERVIAHEYFHNWTGDRVTCRDWFQLTLKEGLTVFRDHEFSSDMNNKELRRLEDAIALKTVQFPEDMGPTSHPIQPKTYLEVNNFYTRTVYEKGSEVIGMICTLIGWENFRKGMERYFELFDGMAVTTEDFVHAMEVVSQKDLSIFRRWYDQNGTPELNVNFTYNEEEKTLILDLQQSCNPMVKTTNMKPFHFPLRIGFISIDGKEVTATCSKAREDAYGMLIEMKEEEETFVFENVEKEVIPSINRRFSAPIQVHLPLQKHDYLLLMRHDSDSYNRFEAGQEVALELMLKQVELYRDNHSLSVDTGYLRVFGELLRDKEIDPALKAFFLMLPSETIMMQRQEKYAFEANYEVREFFAFEIARHFEEDFWAVYREMQEKEYHLNPQAKGKRALKNRALYYLSLLGKSEGVDTLFEQYTQANNMTDRFTALRLLCNIEAPQKHTALEDFYGQFRDDPLVLMKWFSAQAASKLDTTFERVQALIEHPAFDLKIPNHARALLYTFSENHNQFHSLEHPTYAFFTDMILKLDTINPYVASKLCHCFKKYQKLDDDHQVMMQKEMKRILEKKNLSPNVYEIISNSLSI